MGYNYACGVLVLDKTHARSSRAMRASIMKLVVVLVPVVADGDVLDGLLVNASDRVFLLGSSQVRRCDRLR